MWGIQLQLSSDLLQRIVRGSPSYEPVLAHGARPTPSTRMLNDEVALETRLLIEAPRPLALTQPFHALHAVRTRMRIHLLHDRTTHARTL